MSARPAVRIALMLAFVWQVPVHTVWAQSDAAIRGQVIATADDSGLAGAAIILTSSSGSMVEHRAEASGWFAFSNIAAGDYVLSVTAPGFAGRELRLSIEPREIRTVTVPLELAGVAVAVEVSGDRVSAPSTHSPSSTTLTRERLDAMPVFQRVALPDAIVRLAPGMIRGHDDFVHIRGHEIALNPLINGVSFWENTHSVFSAGLSPDVIDTANVMTGGFPAEYGNRFGGVVDVVTRSGLRMQNRGAATVSAGTAGRRRVAGDFGGRRGRFGYFLSGSGFASERYLSPPAPTAIHDAAHGGHAFAQFDRTIGQGLFRAVVMGDAMALEIPRSAADIALRPLAEVEQDTRQASVIASWMGIVGDVGLTASSYQRVSQARLFPAEGPLTVRAAGDRRLSTFGVKLDATRLAGRHAVKAGFDAVRLAPRETLSYAYNGYLEYTHLIGLPHVHVSLQEIAFDGADSGGQVSAYLQDSIQLGSRATLDVGLRVDRYQLIVSTTHLSPRVNFALRTGGRTVLHVSYNHFFVPPPIEGVLSNSAGLTRSIDEIGVALPPLAPTVEDQYEGGVSTGFGPFELAVTGYHRATDNPVHTTIWPDSRIYSYASFHLARASGVEARLEAKSIASGVTGYLNYALGRVRFQNPVTGGFVTEAGHLLDTNRFLAPMDQTHTMTGGATYRHSRTGVWLSGAIEYGSGTPMGHGAAHDHAAGTGAHAHTASGPDPARVPEHVTADASFGINLLRAANRRPRLILQIDLENLTDNVYVIAQEGEFSPSQFSIPRLLSLTARFSF